MKRLKQLWCAAFGHSPLKKGGLTYTRCKVCGILLVKYGEGKYH